MQNFYYVLLSFANEKEQPGAELNAPGISATPKSSPSSHRSHSPEIACLSSSGQATAFWLRHFVQNTPGFQLIEPSDYLGNSENRLAIDAGALLVA